MNAAAQPDYVSRCVYCGELAVPAPRSCCGERHFYDVPECPECGGELDSLRHDVTGIETYTFVCRECDWASDPE